MLSKNARLFAFFTCFITWAGLVLQYYIVVKNADKIGLTAIESTTQFFGYFTILSNILVAISLTAVLYRRGPLYRFFSNFSSQTAVGVYIFLVGLGYNILLRHLYELKGLQIIANEIQHLIVPVLYTLYWLFFLPKSRLSWKNILPWLIFPFFYVVFALIRGTIDGFYPYPFIDVKDLGYAAVIKNAAGLLVVLVIVSVLFIGVARMSEPRFKGFKGL
ncbi:MAG: Pr6Pr family membrane protein [Chitinophagaceae bacterium]